MFARIESYSYDSAALDNLRKSRVLDIEPDDYTDLSFREFLAMRKSLQMADKYLRMQKAKVKMPAGARWITVHPNGEAGEGQPIMIQETGEGTAHVIAGAGGRLNGLKLNKIRSKDEYRRAVADRREKEKLTKMQEKLEEQKKLSDMSLDERKEYRAGKKAAKEEQENREMDKNEKRVKAESDFIEYMASVMGWEKTDYEEEFKQGILDLQHQVTKAEEDGDDATVTKLQKELSVMKKARARAMKSQRANYLASAKEAVRSIHREIIADPELRGQIEEVLEGGSGADEEIKKENGGNSLGFQTNYRDIAEEKGLSAEELAAGKEQVFNDRIQEIAEENPRLAAMITKGIETNRRIAAAKAEIYREEEASIKPIAEVDKQAEILKRYLEMKKAIHETEGGSAVQITLDGTVEEAAETSEDIVYGRGVSLSYTEMLDSDIADEAEAMVAERQAAVHSSLLDTIEKNPGGSGKWIANGNYAGFNSIALAAMGSEGLDRDVVDVLGVSASAKLLAMMARNSMQADAYKDFAEGMEKYHKGVNETIASDAIEQGKELLARAESIQAEIDANPGDLAVAAELNESRLQYLDEANRIVGQALGSLEASAAMVLELKSSKNPESFEVPLGNISTEDAIVRLRALGLESSDYEISTVNGTKFATIVEPNKLVPTADPEDLKIEQEIEDIKSGAQDVDGWLPAGLVRRSTDSFEDPGPDAEYTADSVENQSLGDDAESIAKTEEAVHRTLGDMPEGSFAFKSVDALSPEEQTDLRRYWESKLYRGSMAERGSTRDMKTGEAISRQGAWQKFLKGTFGDNQEAAFDAIREDLIQNHSMEDMWGEKDIPPLAKVVPGQWSSYRRAVEGAGSLFQEIDDLRNPETVTDPVAAEREASRLESELPEKLTELYESQMREHYLKYMSGYTEEQFDAGGERQEKTPWGEYVRMHGDVGRAQAAVLDTLRGDFTERFVKNYSRITKTKLRTKTEKIRNWQDHVLGMLDREMRDSVMNKVQAELSSAGATVANREGGKFASGSWKEKALKYIEEKRRADASQAEMFGGEELKQNDGTEILSIGNRAEAQLASIIPQIAVNQRRGQKYAVSLGMQTKGERQRAIRMFETAKRMNLTFGTGKGKTIISIASFTELQSKGKAKRAIFAVPSVVQSQFGNEVNVFCKPGKYHVKSDPMLSQEERIQALKDGNLDMVVFTHQGLRNDLIHVMGTQAKLSDEDMKNKFNAMSPDERRDTLGAAMKAEGIAFDMLTVDESHYTTNRKGKEDATLANVLDALNQNVDYFMNQSATPVKNDASEAFDMLRKVAPDRFTDRDAFLKKYGVDSQFSRRALQRLINRYNYASKTVTGTIRKESREDVSLTVEQQAEYDKVGEMFRRASKAQHEGRVDVEAMKYLSPGSFKGLSEDQYEDNARRLQISVGVVKEEALNRVVNQFDWKRNAKINRVVDIIDSKTYDEDNPRTAAKRGDKKPGVIFAHNLATVENLRKALSAKKLRIGIIQGSMNGAEKEKVKVGFNPPNPADRIYDVLLCSDAGATGLNLQNAAYLMNFDLPQTAWVKQQREGRIDRPGQAHAEIEYHDIVSATDHERTRWDRIQRKKALGSIFEEDPGVLDDTGLAATIANVRLDRLNQGDDEEKAA
ncbi:MAG: hypothetical protein SAMD01599839_07950 [Rectinema sp.]